MQNKEITKKKNDILKSIMSNPKLAKTFSEAFSSPIGSTKRKQVKSVLSIIKKMGGIKADGKGGMESGVGLPPPSTASAPPTKNYSNMIIFPAAPAFKKRAPQPTASPAPTPLYQSNIQSNDGKGGSETGLASGTNDVYSWENPVPTVPAYSWEKSTSTTPTSTIGPGIIPRAYGAYQDWGMNAYPKLGAAIDKGAISTLGGIGQITAGVGQTIGQNSLAALEWGRYGLSSLFLSGLPKPTTPFIAPQNTAGFKALGDNIVNAFSGPEAVQPASHVPANACYPGNSTPYPTNLTGVPQTGVTEEKKMDTTGTDKKVVNADGTTTIIKADGTTTTVTTPSTTSNIPASWSYPGGATGYALDAVDKRYPGGLAAYMASIQKKATDELGPLETELSNLKSRKENLIPTLTNYVKGKDQYLRYIDEMIRKQEANYMDTDMTDPEVASLYNKSIAYLYTLKGRQETRYGNFLKSATADYEAEVARTQANYDTVANRLQTALTQEGAIAQEDYNNIYNRALALATEAKGAEAAAYSLGILKNQWTESNKTVLGNIPGTPAANEALQAEIKGWISKLSIDKGISDSTTGTVDFTTIPVNGLSSLYYQNQAMGGDERAVTEAIRTVFQRTLQNENTTPEQKTKMSQMIEDLKNTPETAAFGNTLSKEFASGSGGGVVTTTNLSKVKEAVNDLAYSYGGFLGFGKTSSGVQDPEAWKVKYTPILGVTLTNKLLKAITKAMASETYANKPDVLVKEIFADGTGKILDDIISVIQ